MSQTSLFGAVIETPAQASTYHPDTPLNEVVFTVFDLETTGLNPKRNAITEITAIQFKAGEELEKFSTLVKPTEDIPEIVTDITGITNDMVAQAPPPVMALSELCQFVGPQPVMVGHNVQFDVNFIQAKLEETSLSQFSDRFIMERSLCTRNLAKLLYPELPSYEGTAVAHHCGIYNPNPHRAEYDVRMSASTLFVMIKQLPELAPKIKTIGDLITYQLPPEAPEKA